MALTPKTNDAFFREVDDEVRRERMETAARRYGVIIAVVVVLGLAAFGGFLAWRSHQETVAGERGEQFAAALSALSSGKDAEARQGLDAVVATDTRGYTPLARITQAVALVKDGKDADASAAFLKIATDGSVPQQFRDLALIRATALDFDKAAPKAVIDRLKPLTIPGNAWYGSAGEMTGIAYLKLNQPKKAGALFVSVAKDPGVPRTIRARTAQLASDLGFEVGPAAGAVQPADSAAS